MPGEPGRVHGDAAVRRAGPGALDFAVNVNPFGPDPAVLTAVRSADVSRYPEPTGGPARRALGEHLGADPDRIALGHGAVELLWTLARLHVPPGAGALVVGPAFSELALAVEAGGARAIRLDAAPPDFKLDLLHVANHIARVRPALVYVANPANPSGRAVCTTELAGLAADFGEVTFVWDEAFLSLSRRHDERGTAVPPNVIRVRSLTKDHALPGVRVGYLLSTPDHVRRLEAMRPPWTPSAFAQAAVIATCAPEAEAHVVRSRRALLALRQAMAKSLRALGLRLAPSDTIFGVTPVGDAASVHAGLQSRGVVVRDCTSFGLPGHIRLCARPPQDVHRLVAALGEVLP